MEIEALSISKICNPLGPVQVDFHKNSHLQGLTLADSYPRGSVQVDVLIGVRARSDLGTVPHCLIVEISYLLPQNVRKNMRLQSLKGIKLYVIETQFLEPHILYVGLLDLVTIE